MADARHGRHDETMLFKGGPRLSVTEWAVGKHAAGIFAKLDLALSDDDNRRVLAVLAYLESL
jgi:hypothetical protein